MLNWYLPYLVPIFKYTNTINYSMSKIEDVKSVMLGYIWRTHKNKYMYVIFCLFLNYMYVMMIYMNQDANNKNSIKFRSGKFHGYIQTIFSFYSISAVLIFN